MKAKKQPVVIEYYPLTRKYAEHIHEWSTRERPIVLHIPTTHKEPITATITTLEGTYTAHEHQDVIIKGVQGEVYPCKIDIFNQTYNPLPDEHTEIQPEPERTALQIVADFLASHPGKHFKVTGDETTRALVIEKVQE